MTELSGAESLRRWSFRS